MIRGLCRRWSRIQSRDGAELGLELALKLALGLALELALELALKLALELAQLELFIGWWCPPEFEWNLCWIVCLNCSSISMSDISQSAQKCTFKFYIKIFNDRIYVLKPFFPWQLPVIKIFPKLLIKRDLSFFINFEVWNSVNDG